MAAKGGLLNAKEAAELLGLKECTIRQWVWQRRIPVVRLGKAVRIKREDLEELIERRREPAVVAL